MVEAKRRASVEARWTQTKSSQERPRGSGDRWRVALPPEQRFAAPTSGTNACPMAATTPSRKVTPEPRAPGILLGIGLGGFVDGIVFHQILQWHHMLTSEGRYPKTTVAGLETNTLWDGLFHASTWVAVVAGLWISWRRTDAWRWATSGRALVGWMLVGWALFNLVEGIVDHHILTIHHVREGVAHQSAYDAGFV